MNNIEKEDKSNSIINFNIVDEYCNRGYRFVDVTTTPLYIACFYKFENIIKLLVNYGANVNIQNNKGENVLNFQGYYESLADIATLLIKYRVNKFIKDKEGNLPLHIASEHYNLNLIKLLVNYGININEINNKGETPLHKACSKNINKTNNNGETPLMQSCCELTGYEYETLMYLIDHGADLHKTNNYGETPFLISSDINGSDNEGNTPLFIACKYMKVGVKLPRDLVEMGAYINKPNNNGETPLFELSLLNLSAGDNDGNIIEHATKSGYLSVNVKSKKGSPSEDVSIVDIIPTLKEIQNDNDNYPTDDDKKKAITKKYKELYIKAEKIACNKLGHTYEEHGSLFSRYYSDEDRYMRTQFNNKLDDLDFFSELNDDGIKLINGDHDVSTLSLYDSSPGRFQASSTLKLNNNIFIDPYSELLTGRKKANFVEGFLYLGPATNRSFTCTSNNRDYDYTFSVSITISNSASYSISNNLTNSLSVTNGETTSNSIDDSFAKSISDNIEISHQRAVTNEMNGSTSEYITILIVY
ncbi:hypothetical protein PIROE2DRAFT_14488 [Piromyces sp. E2]|nr:hypothetical protein PIROE2DRAFT_14488 [Piromyces sp. E2]|eukprot:OUM59879.1 hypothetical protein PIROE2DRAFT_14488 [Piromyces sp. E2]